MESSGELKLESEAQQNEAPEGSVVDTGSGVTGELIIN